MLDGSASSLAPHCFDGGLQVPFSSRTISLPTAVGSRSALVFSPDCELVLSTPPGGNISPLDRWILGESHAAAERAGASVCIFRARADAGPGRYGFCPLLSDAQAVELASALLVGALPVYREMVRLGICLLVYAELGADEAAAFREGARAVCARLEARIECSAQAEVDLWILQNLVFFFTTSFESLSTSVLPEKLPMMETRMERVRRMVATTDATAPRPR